jgi:hypothetical protein
MCLLSPDNLHKVAQAGRVVNHTAQQIGGFCMATLPGLAWRCLSGLRRQDAVQ